MIMMMMIFVDNTVTFFWLPASQCIVWQLQKRGDEITVFLFFFFVIRQLHANIV